MKKLKGFVNVYDFGNGVVFGERVFDTLTEAEEARMYASHRIGTIDLSKVRLIKPTQKRRKGK